MKRLLRSLLSLQLLTLACHPRKNPAIPADQTGVSPSPLALAKIDPAAIQNAAEADTETPPAAIYDLPGIWTQCTERVVPETSVLSSLATLVVSAGSMETTFRFFADSGCQKPYTQAEMERDVAEFDKKNAVPTPPELKDGFKSLVAGDMVKVGYNAEKAAPGQVGALDIVSAGGNEFLSYKIIGKELFISDSCLPKDIDPTSEDNCELEGESASHRSVDFGSLRPYIRKDAP